jgi:GDPmannose 4,6-dehydratase
VPKRALITGVAGQDGSYLAELLLGEGYEVFGVVRDPAASHDNLAAVADRITLIRADLLDQSSLQTALVKSRPDEAYNLAAPSFVPMSWDEPVLTAQFAAVGATAILEAIRETRAETRFYQASSSEIFGEPRQTPQNEQTPLAPVTPYGVAKAYAHFIVGSYRRRYGLFACSGILYNHESPRRPLDFVTRKVAHAAARIALGLDDELTLGNLDTRRTMCVPCGSCFSRTSHGTTLLEPASATRCGISSSVRSGTPGSTGSTTSASTMLCAEEARSSTTSLAMPRWRETASSGLRASISRGSSAFSSRPSWRR